MLHRHLLAAVAALLLAVAMPTAWKGAGWLQAQGREAGDFVAGVEDLPLMPGLSEIETASIVFDAPSGRIVEAYAAGPVTRDQVLAFYGATLPELGWTSEQQTQFHREGEMLRLDFLDGEELTVRFTLSPD
ncbi:hypothetical protein [Rhodospirillaceae bacterium SYSU D60014]|uniref:hypothetical protein n=1 Tax=Virgifigura deserti TaxID=2268457 RepID=UPI000E66CACD